MLRVLKSSGRVTSSANDKSTTNSRGRVELSLSGTPESDQLLQFTERGNYGKVRWSTTVRVTRQEVESLVRSAQDWLNGVTQRTLEDQPVAETATQRDVEVTPEDKTTFELVNGNR